METTLHDLMTRRSVRSYTDKMPPKEMIEDILKAGMNAPSGKNRQSAIILAVTNLHNQCAIWQGIVRGINL